MRLMIAMLFTLVACGDKDEDTGVEQAQEVEEASEEESGDTGEAEDTSSEVEQ